MRESLLGRPTAEIISQIVEEKPSLRHFYLARYKSDVAYLIDEEKHVDYPANLYPVERDLAVGSNWLDVVKKELYYEEYISIISRVMGDWGFEHLPMVDFDFKNNSDFNLDKVKEVLADLCFPNGYIAFSGRGYHYIGSRLMPEWGFNNALKALGRLRKASGIDRKWLEMAERQGFFALRLTRGVGKPTLPTVAGFHFLQGRPTETGTPWNICATRYGVVINQYTLEGWWELQQAEPSHL